MNKTKYFLSLSAIGLATSSLAAISSVTGDFTIATPSDVSSSPATPVAALDIFAESTATTPSSAVLLDTVATGSVHIPSDLVPGTTTPWQLL